MFDVMSFYGSIFCLMISGSLICGQDLFALDIIHYNDFHANYEALCRSAHDCVGGFPRLYYYIHMVMARKPHAILLNAGDNFQGTFWYNLFKWKITLEFMNLLPHDAHALGNHEFDDGPIGLAPYLRGLKAPMLVANMDVTREPILQDLCKPSIVVERNGRKIGIIGLITVNAEMYAMTGDVIFTDAGEAAEREAIDLSRRGVDIIIVLSHCGLAVDKEIARKHGKLIDVIVGGHSHSYLWNGNDGPNGRNLDGPYPVIVQSANTKHKVVIVHAFPYGRSIGDLTVYFDDNGDYVRWEGGPVSLDNKIPEDFSIKKRLIPYTIMVRKAARIPVGYSYVQLNSGKCNFHECGLGDLLTDAMVEYVKEHIDPSLHYLAFAKSGSFYHQINKDEVITELTLFRICPNREPMILFKLRGKYLRRVLEITAKRGELQQVSGLQVSYKMSQPEGQRVSNVTIVGKSMAPLENKKYYNIITARVFTLMGKGFQDVRKHMRKIIYVGRDLEMLKRYIRKHSPIREFTFNERIKIEK